MATSGVGLQSSLLAEARAVVREKLLQRIAENGAADKPKRKRRTHVVIAYTSNLISCGLRETFASLAKAKAADAFISTAGGIEEDIIKCLGDTIVGDFALKGADLRLQGLNRVGNLIIPNDNYIDFETFFVPIIKQLHQAQLASDWAPGKHTSPSALIRLVGETLDQPSSDAFLTVADHLTAAQKDRLREEAAAAIAASASPPLSEAEAAAAVEASVAEKLNAAGLEHTRSQSLVCCCARAGIPMYCPALTDGSMGDMICFYSFNKKGFVCDPAEDYKCLIDIAAAGEDDGDGADGEEFVHDVLVLALGAGLPRNHALHLTPTTGRYRMPAADASQKQRVVTVERTVVQIVTSNDVDGCNSGAQLADDLAEGLVGPRDKVIRVHGEATMLLPMIVAGLQ